MISKGYLFYINFIESIKDLGLYLYTDYVLKCCLEVWMDVKIANRMGFKVIGWR